MYKSVNPATSSWIVNRDGVSDVIQTGWNGAWPDSNRVQDTEDGVSRVTALFFPTLLSKGLLVVSQRCFEDGFECFVAGFSADAFSKL